MAFKFQTKPAVSPCAGETKQGKGRGGRSGWRDHTVPRLVEVSQKRGGRFEGVPAAVSIAEVYRTEDFSLEGEAVVRRPKGFVFGYRGVEKVTQSNSDYLWSGYNTYRTVARPVKEGGQNSQRAAWRRWLVKEKASCFWHSLLAVIPTSGYPALEKVLGEDTGFLSDGVSEKEATLWVAKLPVSIYCHNVLTGTVDVAFGDKSGRTPGLLLLLTNDAGEYEPHWVPVYQVYPEKEHWLNLDTLRAVRAGVSGEPNASRSWLKMLDDSIAELTPELNDRQLLLEAFGEEIVNCPSGVLKGLGRTELGVARPPGPRKQRRPPRQVEPPVEFQGDLLLRARCLEYQSVGLLEAFHDELDAAYEAFGHEHERILADLEWEVLADVGPRRAEVEMPDIGVVVGVDAPPTNVKGRASWYSANVCGASPGAYRADGEPVSLWKTIGRWLMFRSTRAMVEARPEIIRAGAPIDGTTIIYSTVTCGKKVQENRRLGGAFDLSQVTQIRSTDGTTFEIDKTVSVVKDHYGVYREHQVATLKRVHTPVIAALKNFFMPWRYETTSEIMLKPVDHRVTGEDMVSFPDRESRIRAAAALIRQSVADRHVGTINEIRNSILGSEAGDVDQFLEAVEQYMNVSAAFLQARPDMVRAFAYA